MTPDWDIRNSIAIVVVLDLLHDVFSTTIESMLKWEDETIDKIQQIFASTEAKFISKRATEVNKDQAMISRNRNSAKQKASSKDKCFNYEKLDH